ncbi:matrixin family metalloprotease [Arthrobacter globiformis]|uniref:matrixin family metalloprotease n=1 Tax=Arthrobacter globiformis TaxID=1665 RepID=UPI000B4096C1|nr:matrixin family metalloprotease [Arthrobacter globiformis]
MADQALWNAGDQPRVWINWDTFTAQGVAASWQLPFQEAVINAYTRWMAAGVDCRFQFYGYTTRTEPSDGEILITMNERHFDTTRIASTFGSWRKISLVIHRKNGANLTNWNIVPYNADPGEIDLQGVLLHEFGHCYWLDHSTSGNEAMTAGYNYHSARMGPWNGDVGRVKALYRDFDRNRLREFASYDAGQSWFAMANQLTNYNHYQARTCLGPGVAAIGSTGLFSLNWSHPNRIPTWLRNNGSTFLFNNWIYYGGERAVHGNSVASAVNGTMLWAWVDEEDSGSLRIVRSTNTGGSWAWANVPAGATTYGQPGLAVTTVGGVRTWVLVWAHFDRSDHTGTGYLRSSISTNDGGSWSQPRVINTFYKSLAGVAVAASDTNEIMVGFSWAPHSTNGMNAVRTLSCRVTGGELNVTGIGNGNAVSRLQPALAYDRGSQRFIMAFREQNFLTSLRVATKKWADASWPAATQLAGTTTATAPALASAPNGMNVLWYGGE